MGKVSWKTNPYCLPDFNLCYHTYYKWKWVGKCENAWMLPNLYKSLNWSRNDSLFIFLLQNQNRY
jgi:hypothetical protein